MLKNLFKRKSKQIESEISVNEFQDINTQQKPKMSRKKKIIITSISLILVLFIALGAVAFKLLYIKKQYEYVSSFATLASPLQEDATGEFLDTIDGYEIKYEIKANYTLYGKVVEKYYYFPNKIINKISRFDFGMIYGPLLEAGIDDKINFKNNGSRFLTYSYPSSLNSALGSKETLIDSISNNHMIHSSETILKYLRNVKEGDHIKIEGYLVNVYYTNKNSKGTWPTSLSRTDHGDGACEVIYVTNITWLKIK